MTTCQSGNVLDMLGLIYFFYINASVFLLCLALYFYRAAPIKNTTNQWFKYLRWAREIVLKSMYSEGKTKR